MVIKKKIQKIQKKLVVVLHILSYDKKKHWK